MMIMDDTPGVSIETIFNYVTPNPQTNGATSTVGGHPYYYIAAIMVPPSLSSHMLGRCKRRAIRCSHHRYPRSGDYFILVQQDLPYTPCYGTLLAKKNTNAMKTTSRRLKRAASLIGRRFRIRGLSRPTL